MDQIAVLDCCERRHRQLPLTAYSADVGHSFRAMSAAVCAKTTGLCWIRGEASTRKGRGRLDGGHSGAPLTHRATLERDVMAVMHEPVEGRIGECAAVHTSS